MKAGLTTSVIMHAAIIGICLFSLKAPAAFDVADVEALPVDIVPMDALTQIQEGDKKSPMRDKSAPLPTERPDVVADAQKVGDNSVDTEEPATPDPKPKPVDTTSAPPPAPEPKDPVKAEDVPKPKEEPKPVPTTERAAEAQPKQDVTPDPVKAPEPKPEPVKKAEPKPAPPTPETTAAVEPQPKPDKIAKAIAADQPTDAVPLPNSAPAPDARPKPQQAEAESAKAPERKNSEKPVKQASARPKSDEKEFNADEISALLNKQKPSGGGAKRSTREASLGGKKSTGGNKLSQNEMDALRQKLGGCWSIPAGVDDADTLKVSVRFYLDRSGMLEGRPQVIKGGAASGPGRTAAESAVRAVQKCAPFNLPADKYDSWSEVVVNFDPSDMF
jgi:colicin import membrane protein